jgi:protein-disulfide isomerase
MGDKVEYEEIDISKDATAITKYHIQSTPTMVILGRGGEVLDTIAGVPGADELKSKLEKAASQ